MLRGSKSLRIRLGGAHTMEYTLQDTTLNLAVREAYDLFPVTPLHRLCP